MFGVISLYHGPGELLLNEAGDEWIYFEDIANRKTFREKSCSSNICQLLAFTEHNTRYTRIHKNKTLLNKIGHDILNSALKRIWSRFHSTYSNSTAGTVNENSKYTERRDPVACILFHIREVPGWNLGLETGNPDRGFSWFSSAPTDKGHDRFLPYPFQLIID
jgi:hypothetical protein